MRLGLQIRHDRGAVLFIGAHSSGRSQVVGTLQALLAKGARLDWDVQPA